MGRTTVLFLLSMILAAALLNPDGSAHAALESDPVEMQRDYQRQEERLNGAYQAARQNLDDTGRSALKTTERAWVTFKEKDFAIFSGLAKAAQATDRMFRYATEASEARASYLASVAGKPEYPGKPEVKTAREADQMLNNSYRQCIGLLPSNRAQMLKAAQADWISYRDLHCQFDALLKNGRVDDAVLRDVTMARVVEFRHYLLILIPMQLPVPEDTGVPRDKAELTPTGTPPADLFRFARGAE